MNHFVDMANGSGILGVNPLKNIIIQYRCSILALSCNFLIIGLLIASLASVKFKFFIAFEVNTLWHFDNSLFADYLGRKR